MKVKTIIACKIAKDKMKENQQKIYKSKQQYEKLLHRTQHIISGKGESTCSKSKQM